jgi:hypothetical protein
MVDTVSVALQAMQVSVFACERPQGVRSGYMSCERIGEHAVIMRRHISQNRFHVEHFDKFDGERDMMTDIDLVAAVRDGDSLIGHEHGSFHIVDLRVSLIGKE